MKKKFCVSNKLVDFINITNRETENGINSCCVGQSKEKTKVKTFSVPRAHNLLIRLCFSQNGTASIFRATDNRMPINRADIEMQANRLKVKDVMATSITESLTRRTVPSK